MSSRTVPALLLAALLALGGFAAASDGDGTAPPPGSDGPHGNQTAPPPPPPGNGTAPPPGDGHGNAPPPPNCDRFPAGSPDRQRCLRERYCHDHPDACGGRNGSRPLPPRGDNASRRRPSVPESLEHIQFTLDGPRRLSNYTVDGQLLLSHLALDTGGDGPLMTGRAGDAIVVGDANTRLRLHDNPVGLIEFKGADGGVRLDFPAGIQRDTGPEGHVTRIHYPGGANALLVADGASWDGASVTLTGFFTFHVVRLDGPFADEMNGGELRAKLQAAVEDRHLGAEVQLERHPENASQMVQVLAYDDVAVQVHLPPAAVAGPAAPIAVRLSANLTQGRTIVLHVDPALVGNATADRLELHYYDNHADGTQTEVVFAKADSLADVLDPTNDGGRPEYWVVQDADGLQVLISVPHWSVHTVTLSGLAALAQPSVLLGLVAGGAGVAVAAVALFWPRRQDQA